MQEIHPVCPSCRQPVVHEIRSVWPGTSDDVVVVQPCPECFPNSEEVGYQIGEAIGKQEHDTTVEVLRKLLSQASVMSMYDAADQTSMVGILKHIIRAHDDLESFLYLIEKEYEKK